MGSALQGGIATAASATTSAATVAAGATIAAAVATPPRFPPPPGVAWVEYSRVKSRHRKGHVQES